MIILDGMYKVIEEIDIGTIYVPYNQYSKECYDKMITATAKKGKEISIINTDDKYTLGEANWKVISVDNSSPKIENDEAINDTSIVIELEYKNTKYLFMGDASSKIEENLLKNLSKVDVLKVAHHGSNKSTSNEFLKRVKPKYSIISVGKNSYNHPDNRVIKRLEDIKTEIYTTQDNGTIWITSNGEFVKLEILDCNVDGANRKVSYMEGRNALCIII